MTLRSDLPDAIKKLRPFAIKLAGIQVADDLLQTTALRALQSDDQFTPGTNLGAWLNTIMRNEFRDYLRRERYRSHPNIDHLPEHSLSCPGNQETMVFLREVVSAVTRLNPPFREVIEAYVDEDDMHNRPAWPGVRRSRLCRARGVLKEMVV